MLTLVALTSASVIVSPIVAATPLFSLVISLIFLRGKEQVTGATVFGAVAVVAGAGRYRARALTVSVRKADPSRSLS